MKGETELKRVLRCGSRAEVVSRPEGASSSPKLKRQLTGSYTQSSSSWKWSGGAGSCTGYPPIVLCALGSTDKAGLTLGTSEVKQNKMVASI